MKALTASDIQNRLMARYRAPEWASFLELRDATGFAQLRTIDFMTVNTYPSKGLLTLAAEVKVSRQDFHRELNNPDKRARFMEQVNEFYFAAPRGLIGVQELPAGVGLIETRGDGVAVTRRAEQRPSNRPSHQLWISLIRRSREDVVQLQEEAQRFAEFRGRTIGLPELRHLVKLLYPRIVEDAKLRAENEAHRNRRTQAKERAAQRYEDETVLRRLRSAMHRWADLPWSEDVKPEHTKSFLDALDNLAGMRKVGDAIHALTNGKRA